MKFDFKWILMLVTLAVALLVAGNIVVEYRKMDCRLTLGQQGKTTDEISETCKR